MKSSDTQFDIDTLIIKTLNEQINKIISLCFDSEGEIQIPDKKEIIKIRYSLPDWCSMHLKGQSKKKGK